MSNSVIVTPLQPPFKHPVMRISFKNNEEKMLAVSLADFKKLSAMLSHNVVHRSVVLEPIDDRRVMISVVQ